MGDMSINPVPSAKRALYADTFGARLALVRQAERWNMKEAALACGLAEASWREWEVNDRLPRDLQQVSEKISANSGVDAIWLMTGMSVVAGGPDDTPTGNSPHVSIASLASHRAKRDVISHIRDIDREAA